ncbi:Equilibrative nucleotide transporter 2 [Camellia lanceoleosa]|uniref:Equilibrative nucleotide transporter 2 n=1 Tax=Camellia lanceoleosa TaxID=1840588 RepID=A0ACC0IB20_9ERIC|nr:Equilibrative nucleotide transporter 2 [Camellia lanceoleosa]
MRLLSIRKYQAKSQKKLELCLRLPYNGYQKHQSSVHSRFSSPEIPPLKGSCISTICTWDTCNTDIQRGKNQYQKKKPIWIYHFFHKCSCCSCSYESTLIPSFIVLPQLDLATSRKGRIGTYIGICIISGAFGVADAYVQGGMVGDLSLMLPEFLQVIFVVSLLSDLVLKF